MTACRSVLRELTSEKGLGGSPMGGGRFPLQDSVTRVLFTTEKECPILSRQRMPSSPCDSPHSRDWGSQPLCGMQLQSPGEAGGRPGREMQG